MKDTLLGLSFLVAKDDLLVAGGLREILLKNGSTSVEVASAIEQAIALTDAARFDVALLDISLPDGETPDFAKTLLSKDVHLVF